jgi:hypothetical protein
MFCQANLGWFACLPAGEPRPLGLTLGNGLDVTIEPALGAFARDALTAKDPAPVAARHLLSAGSPLWDKLADIVATQTANAAWREIGVPGRPNVVTGQPSSIGLLDPAGRPRYQGVDESVAGTALDSGWLGGSLTLGKRFRFASDLYVSLLTLGKRFRFASDLDVSLLIYADKDAALAGQASNPLAGGGVSVTGRTSRGAELKLRIGAGRDQAGGAAGFFLLQIGPDIPPAPVTDRP